MQRARTVLIVHWNAAVFTGCQEKLRAELRTGAVVVSNGYPFPTWEPTAVLAMGGGAGDLQLKPLLRSLLQL